MRKCSAFLLLGSLACDAATDPAIPAAPAISDVRADAGYTVTSLGVIPGETWSEAFSINDQNLVVGSSGAKAFWYRLGTMKELRTLPGAVTTSARDVNKSDHVVGFARTSWGPLSGDAVLWKSITQLPILVAPGLQPSIANAINDADVVVGYATFPASPGATHAFRWSPASGTADINPVWALSSFAYDVDAAGQVVGSACTPSDCFAVRWSTTGVVTILGILPGGTYASGFAVYGARVAGYSTTAGVPRGFLWNALTGMTEAIGFDGIYGLSAKDRIVGAGRWVTWFPLSAVTARLGVPGLTYLPSLFAGYGQASAVNVCGLIVGYSTDPTSWRRAMMWTPPVCD